MSPKKIILCPNPNRDQGTTATKAAEKILHEMGFHTVVCSPFKDQKEGAFADCQVRSLPQEMKGAVDHLWRRRHHPASGQAGGPP